MNIRGRVRDGVVVFEEPVSLPEGAAVTVSYRKPTQESVPNETAPEILQEPGRLPVVRGGPPGSVVLTNERIYEILDAEDIKAMKRSRNVSS